MIINSSKKYRDLYFYNNLLLIVVIFSVICFGTYFKIEFQKTTKVYNNKVRSGQMFGPITIKKDKPLIYTIKSNSAFLKNRSIYFSGEVLDKNKDVLYEFGKEFWHESGYDSEGHWSESDTHMEAKLAFTEPGTYYIRIFQEGKAYCQMSIEKKYASGIPHLMTGTWFLLAACIIFGILNPHYIKEVCERIDESLEGN